MSDDDEKALAEHRNLIDAAHSHLLPVVSSRLEGAAETLREAMEKIDTLRPPPPASGPRNNRRERTTQ